MADESIRKDFVDGVYEVFSTLFNEGKEDGIQLYQYQPGNRSIYEEEKYKCYKSPITLVAKVSETPTDGDQDIKAQKNSAIFTVPVKSLNDKGIKISKQVLSDLKKGIILFNDTFYEIDRIQGKAFIENIYIMWEFYCTEDPSITELDVVEEDTDREDTETPDIRVNDLEKREENES